MKKIIITYGIIAGLIVSAMLLISMPLHKNGTLNFDNGMYVGYSTMVISLSLVFVGMKRYRDQRNGGVLTFWQGFKIGILISLIASFLYALTWEVYYNVTDSDYLQQYADYSIKKLKQEGASEAEVLSVQAEMDQIKEYYKIPIVRFAMTLMEIVPVGLVITLLSAAVLRKKEPQPVNV